MVKRVNLGTESCQCMFCSEAERLVKKKKEKEEKKKKICEASFEESCIDVVRP